MTMIEKVARAICSQEGGDPDAITIHQQPQWKIWEGHARAAIDAMREPTQEMQEAGGSALCGKPALIGHASHANWPTWQDAGLLRPELKGAATWCHRAMIDAALADEKAQA